MLEQIKVVISEVKKELNNTESVLYMELTPEQKVYKVKELLNMDHLNAEKKEIVDKILAENADVFHIPGEP